MVPGQILVIDNTSVYRDSRLVELAYYYGVSIEYLPPYLPDYNLIKKSFNQLKLWIKRHFSEAAMYTNFGNFLSFAISEFETGATKVQFETCRYRYSG